MSIHRYETVEVHDTYQYEDLNDSFKREPFSVLISSKVSNQTGYIYYIIIQCQSNLPEPWKVFLLGVPTSVCSELEALEDAYRTASNELIPLMGL